MSSWLDPLVDPHELAIRAQRGSSDPRGGLALLLDAELALYERLAAEYGWPRLAERVPKSAPRERRLLSAVGLELTNSRGAQRTYEGLLRPVKDDPSFFTVVSILYSLSLSDQGANEAAADVLLRALRAARGDPVERILLLLHLGVRRAELDDLVAAVEVTEEAKGERAGRRTHARALRNIAEHNLAAYRWLLGVHTSFFVLPLKGSDVQLLRGAVDISTGLEEYLEGQFEAATEDPYTRTVRWRAQDPVEQPLFGAVARAKCLADWNELRHTRSLLGRYQIVSKLGTSQGVPSQAFALLRRAGNEKGMAAAARAVVAVGPLGGLRSEVLAAIESPWPRMQVAANLTLLAAAADLLQPEEADRALRKLLEPSIALNHAGVAFRAVASVAAVASDRSQNRISRFARRMADERENLLVLQELSSVLRALSWEGVSQVERDRWIKFIEQHRVAGDEAKSLAEVAAAALASTDPDAIASVLTSTLEDGSDLMRVASMLDAGLSLPRNVRRRALDEAGQALVGIRNQAKSGTYGFGGLDVAFLLLALLERDTKDSRWDDLGAFLIDPQVGVDAKVRTIEALADGANAIPDRIQRLLRKNVATITGFEVAPGASEAALRGATLRLWLRLGGVPRDELLSRLLDLAGGLDREARLQAALTLPVAQRRLGNDSTFTLALTMTRDADVTVRATAGFALARLRRERAGEVNDVVRRRLLALLEEPGREVPYRTIAGLVQGVRAGQPVEKETLNAVRRIKDSHPSRRVERSARTLLRESRPPRVKKG